MSDPQQEAQRQRNPSQGYPMQPGGPLPMDEALRLLKLERDALARQALRQEEER